MSDPSCSSETLRHLLTKERLTSYLDACDKDLDAAVTLYEWNMELSGAVMMVTAITEVIVRNALDTEMKRWCVDTHGTESWFDHAPLDPKGRADVLKARSRATRRGKIPEVHGRVIAELTLGFWRYLVAKRYLTSLWVPYLHAAFPGGNEDLRIRRTEVEDRMEALVFVRNRAAHHEPLHKRPVIEDLNAAKDLVRWVTPDAEKWLLAKETITDWSSRKPV